jgi:hypothetical protein
VAPLLGVGKENLKAALLSPPISLAAENPGLLIVKKLTLLKSRFTQAAYPKDFAIQGLAPRLKSILQAALYFF